MRRSRRQRGFARALGLTAVSTVLPGTAHLAAGRRRVGGLLLGSFIALLASGAVVVVDERLRSTARDELLRLAVQTSWLVALMAGAGVAALLWWAMVARSYLVVRPPDLTGAKRALGATFVVLLCALVSLPLAKVGQYAYVQHDLLNSIFQDAPSSSHFASKGREVDDGEPFGGQERINILLLGSDAGKNRFGVRTDSMTLASVDTRTGRTVMFSLPRNLQKVPLPSEELRERFPDGFDGLLTEVYQFAMDRPDLAPEARDPGAELVKQTVAEIVGSRVDFYVLVNLQGFDRLVDALGGVRIRVEEPLSFGEHGGIIEPGYRKLSGSEALWYSRTRNDGSDYTRMTRQRCMLGALARQADPMTVLRRFEDLAGAAKNMVSTDIPRDLLPDLVDLSSKVKGATITNLQFVPPLIETYDPDFDKIRELVDEAIEESESPELPGFGNPRDLDEDATGPTASSDRNERGSPDADNREDPSDRGDGDNREDRDREDGEHRDGEDGEKPDVGEASGEPVALDSVCPYE